MANNTNSPNPNESYPLFFSNPSQLGLGFRFFDQPKKPLLPPPPSVEVLPSEEPAQSVKSSVEPIAVGDGLTLLKGKVSTFDVFGMSNLDLVPGKYEGGLKLWEGSLDLVKTLRFEIREGRLVLRGKRVLELGCGHGLPGIFTGLEGAISVHFQDFNAEVLQFLTIPNVKVNLAKQLDSTGMNNSPDVRFFAGNWSEIHELLLHRRSDENLKAAEDSSVQEASDGYDVILMAETVYELSSLQSLYELIKKCLQRPLGVVYMAGKKHYFGVGGGTRQFLRLVEQDDVMAACMLNEVADGSSNVREVWKFSFK